MTESRAMTTEEMRRAFIEQVRVMVEYWEREACRTPKVGDKLSGLAFSILAMIDGVDMALPAFKLVPDPHQDDEAYHRDNGDNWWVSEGICEDEYLHDLLYQMEPKWRVKGEGQ